MIALRAAGGGVGMPERPPLGAVAVEPLRPHHLRGVLRIERDVYPRPWSRALFESELAQPDNRRYLVALVPRRMPPWRRVVGYAGVQIQAGEAHVTTVAVDPTQHRRKIATRLLLGLLEAALALGARAATLEVRAGNRGAQRLYSAFGFAPVGVRPGYYAETGEDAVIMWAYDLDGPEFRARLQRQRERLEEPGGASGAPDHHVPWVRGRIGLPPGHSHGEEQP